MREVRKLHRRGQHRVRGRGGKQKARSLLAALAWLFLTPVIVRPYDLRDARFCWITPAPFVCQRCLAQGRELVQVLAFEEDGRPVRHYECRDRAQP
ncbi:MAG: hypothetical protein H7A21_04035 [Spirochaetales bacterium]|nr:hypothetical protein [Leptospiraceae bacterium]MCP5480582.1 hypothetical protein [Spirochaetales bacterium]MCP5483932.1 hypothetical protein [Spirochaetales bacterium]